jgi:hypothetical protein
VWAKIADFHDMSWLPGVAKTTGEDGNEPDVAKRQLTLAGGATVDESLTKYEAGAMSYSYRIDKVAVKVLPVNDYSATITVLPAEGGKSTVEWRGVFYRGDPSNDPAPELNDEAALKAVGKVYRAGLESLKKKGRGGQATKMKDVWASGRLADVRFSTMTALHLRRIDPRRNMRRFYRYAVLKRFVTLLLLLAFLPLLY